MTSVRRRGEPIDAAVTAQLRDLPMYRLVMALVRPIVTWWGRLEVTGLELLPTSGPTLVFVNHDSAWDPLVIGVAASPSRQIRALAISTLWRNRFMAWVLDGMGQIPVNRGAGDAHAMDAATRRLAGGECVGVFPEATVSLGRSMRARSGAGRLALAVPDARIVCAAATGVVDVAKFPTRPRIRVRFFEPESGQRVDGESAAELSTRVNDEIRRLAPVARTRKADTLASQATSLDENASAEPSPPRQSQLAAEPSAAAAPAHAPGAQKPLWRGWIHLIWFELSLIAGTVLIVAANTATEIVAVSIYAASLSGLLGASALYHRGSWTPTVHRRLQRLDHLMIFVLFAGTTTPVFLLTEPRAAGLVSVIVMWTLTAIASSIHQIWLHAPDWVITAAFIGLGVTAAFAVPGLRANGGFAATALILLGSLVYCIGGISFHFKRPDPVPHIFGYHEVFHACVGIAATLQFVAIAMLIGL